MVRLRVIFAEILAGSLAFLAGGCSADAAARGIARGLSATDQPCGLMSDSPAEGANDRLSPLREVRLPKSVAGLRIAAGPRSAKRRCRGGPSPRPQGRCRQPTFFRWPKNRVARPRAENYTSVHY